jgi:2-methylfumaryl-CoA isomerase
MRVIEVSSFVAAPLAGMTLAQLGADVIRVDPIGGAADRSRWPLAGSGTSLYWAGLNKGKRSLTIDMHSDIGRQIVVDLVAACPAGSAVVITNAIGRDWLTFESLSAVQPDLIHVQIEGRPDGSPAVDYTVNAEAGFPAVTGRPGSKEPVNHVLPAWDIACGLFAALGVSAAALRRTITLHGEQIRIALADVAVAMAGNLGYLTEAQVNRAERPRIGNHLYGGFGRDFTCADGTRIMVAAVTKRHWHDLVSVTGMTGAVAALEGALGIDLSGDADRFEYRDVLAGLFERWFTTRSGREAGRALGTTSLPWSQYRSFTQVADDIRASGYGDGLFATIDQPGVGHHLAPGIPLTIAGARRVVERAPVLGEHTAQILEEELGMHREEIANLLKRGLASGAAHE